MIAHVIGFRGDPANVDVVLRPAGYAHFFFLMPLITVLEQILKSRDLGLLTKLCSKAEELCPSKAEDLDHKCPGNPVYESAKEMLNNF